MRFINKDLDKSKTKKMNFPIRVIGCLFVLMLITQKLAVNIGSFQMQPCLLLYPIIIFLLLLYKKLYISRNNLCIYLFLLALICFLLLFQQTIHITSLCYFLFIYCFMIFRYRIDYEEREYLRTIFLLVLEVSGVIAIFQFVAQLLGVEYIDIFDYIPNLTLKGFNTYYSISYGANIMKSNGWIYLEPSFLSQFMALGIIIVFYRKIFQKQQIVQLTIFALALLVSFSGTGIALLTVVLVPLLCRLEIKKQIPVIFFGLMMLFLFVNSSYSYSVIDRIFEFRNSNSSSAIRFINPFLNVFGIQNNYLFLGNGPGTVDYIIAANISNYSVIPKMVYEYGMVVSCLFIVYILSFFQCKKSFNLITNAILIMYLFLAGNLLQPVIVYNLIIIFEVLARNVDYTQVS